MRTHEASAFVVRFRIPIMAVTCGLLVATTAHATDPVSAGTISALTYRGGYVMFQLKSGSTNHCAPCPADPAQFNSGAYCWIAQTQRTQLAILLSAKATGLTVSGRVTGISSDCTLYQMTVADN